MGLFSFVFPRRKKTPVGDGKVVPKPVALPSSQALKKTTTGIAQSKDREGVFQLHCFWRRCPLARIVPPRTSYYLSDIEVIPENIMEESINPCKSFPDSKFKFLSASLLKPNKVSLKFRWVGTHTGPAFAFGPYELVPTTDKHVSLDAEHVTITFQNWRIIKVVVVPTGPSTGFHGVYRAIGGLIT